MNHTTGTEESAKQPDPEQIVHDALDKVLSDANQRIWDMFAASSMQGILACSETGVDVFPDELAWECADNADAMMAERAKRMASQKIKSAGLLVQKARQPGETGNQSHERTEHGNQQRERD